MTSTVFVDKVTPIVAAWLNDVNFATYTNVANVRLAPYNATGNGSTNDTAAIQAAITATAAAGGGIVFLPEGLYSVTGLTFPSLASVYLVGVGANATGIKVSGNGVTAISISGISARIGISDLWIGSFAALTGATAISIDGTSSGLPCSEIQISRVKIQNVNSPLNMTNVGHARINDVYVIQSIASAVSGIGAHLTACIGVTIENMDFLATTGTFGNDNIRVDRDCDTIILDNIGIAGGTTGYGIRFLNNGGATGPRLTRALNCFAEDCSLGGYLVSAARDIRLIGCHAAVNDGAGFSVTGGDSIVMDSCLSLSNGQHGYFVSGGTGVGIIGSTATNNSQTTTNTYDGIRIESNVTGVRLEGNKCGDFIFSFTNKQRYGISVAVTGTDYVFAKGNDLQGNMTGAFGNFSTGANNDIDEDGTYTGTLTGFAAPPTGTLRFRREGKLVRVYIPAITGTSNATSCTLTGMPTDIRPQRAQAFPVLITDNGTNAMGWCSVATTGVMTLYPSAALSATGWTNSGTKAVVEQSVGWSLD